MIAFLLAAQMAFASSSELKTTGKVKSFDQKSVTVETPSQTLTFDIRRVVDRKKLRVGETIEISLDDLEPRD